jgi:hypothetical protein
MGRIIRLRNYGVYVHDERGAPHHRPHAHIQLRGRRIASIYLETLVLFNRTEQLPKDLMKLIAENQDHLLDEWARLNDE